MVEWVNVSWYTVDGRNPAPSWYGKYLIIYKVLYIPGPRWCRISFPSTVWVHMNYIAILCSITLQYSITSYLNTSTTDSGAVVDDSDTLCDSWLMALLLSDVCHGFDLSVHWLTKWQPILPLLFSWSCNHCLQRCTKPKTFTYSKTISKRLKPNIYWQVDLVQSDVEWAEMAMAAICPHLKACDGDFPGGRRQCLGSSYLPQNKEFESLPSNG